MKEAWKVKEKILKALRECDGYLSGQQLCELLGVSRTAVWKAIHRLSDEGYAIEAVNKKGYRLVKQPDILSETEIASRIRPGGLGSIVRCYDTVTSTNDEARLLAEHGAAHGTLVVAQCQSRGKGRRLRAWDSPKGQGIWMSLILKPDLPPEKASMMTLLAAMAVADALEAENISCQIKWPNDIVIDGRKVCGILTEMSAQPEMINYIVVGIGINVHNREFPEEIAKVAVSLDMAIGAKNHSPIRRSLLIAGIMEAFERYYERFLKEQKLGFIQADYHQRLVSFNQEVYLIEKDQVRSGKCLGIDDTGCLVAVIDGREEHIMSGEVSVRGVLGYV